MSNEENQNPKKSALGSYVCRAIAGLFIGAIVGMIAGVVYMFAYDALFANKSNISYSAKVYLFVILWGASVGLYYGAIIGTIVGLFIPFKICK